MNPTTLDEGLLRTDLAGLTQVEPPPVTAIEDRSRVLRRRHRSRVLAVVGASGAVLTLAAAGTLHVIGWEPGPDGEVPICTAAETATGAVEAFGVSPSELPKDMRLGWMEPGSPAPTYANARRIESTCANAAIHRMLDIDGSKVTRVVDLEAHPLGPDGDIPWDPKPRSQAEFRTFGGELIVHTSEWVSDGYLYRVQTQGFTAPEMASLLGAIAVAEGGYDLSRWPALDDMEYRVAQELPEDGKYFAWILGTEMPDSDRIPVTLDVNESGSSLWFAATAGDDVTSINGRPAFQSLDGSVSWKPTPTTVAHVDGSLSAGQLLSIARSIEPRPAPDFEGLPTFGD